MSPALLDLNDCNLQLWHGDSHIQSPGFALFNDRDYVFGNEARAAARLNPRGINTRFWWQLGTDPLVPALGPARHTGDLAHAHLQTIHQQAGEPAEVLLAVSDTLQREQLSLLLGIVQQCPFDAVGLVSRSAALASLYQHLGRVLHLELQLHQAALIELESDVQGAELKGTTPIPGCGLLQLQEQLVEIISNAFVRQTRFDPRRKAATEQQLYDTLPATLSRLQQSQETNITVEGYNARIDRQSLAQVGNRLVERICAAIHQPGTDDLLLMDPIVALLPGVDATTVPSMTLQAPDIQAALEPRAELLIQRGEALHYVTRLEGIALRAGSAEQVTGIETVADAATPRPSHLLLAHRAYPLQPAGTPLADGWELRMTEREWHLHGEGTPPKVNGQSYHHGRALRAGDGIEIGNDYQVCLIEVET